MKILFRLCIALIALILIAVGSLALDGQRLPQLQRETLSLELDARPEKVWGLLTGYADQPRWWSELKSASPGTDAQGSRLVDTVNRHGMEISWLVEEASKPKKLTLRIYDPANDLPFSGSTSYQLSAPAGHRFSTTRLLINADLEIPNPVFRSLDRRLGWQRKNLLSFGKALKEEVEATKAK